jgi:hypothetical protein
MTLRQFLGIMFFATIFCWSAWALVLINVDPLQASTSDFLFFYASLLLSLLGTASLGLFGIFFLFRRDDTVPYRFVKKSFAYGMGIACAVVILLYLQSEGYLHYWNVATLGTLALFLILFRLSTKQRLRIQE